MRSIRIAISFMFVFGLMGCGTGEEATMPDVTGKKLDDAYAAIMDAGLDDKDKVKIDGGGTFGVVMESNWTVCAQSPAAGTAVTAEPRLTVDRSCRDESAPSKKSVLTHKTQAEATNQVVACGLRCRYRSDPFSGGHAD